MCQTAQISLLLITLFLILLQHIIVVLAESSGSDPRTIESPLPPQHDVGSPSLRCNKCVFILATGRSGSTSLMDALNQIPTFLIRGEHWRAVGNLYDAYKRFEEAFHAAEQHYGVPPAARRCDSFQAAKRMYGTAVPSPNDWRVFNDFGPEHVLDASRAFYATLFGHYGTGVVSGFKEIRYVCGEYLPAARHCGQSFHGFIEFLRVLCDDVKLIFNSKHRASMTTNMKLYLMDQTGRRTPVEFLDDLATTHRLYDNYVSEHPDHAFRVYMEEMFDPQRNDTLARDLLRFLDQNSSVSISFNRMPPWSNR